MRFIKISHDLVPGMPVYPGNPANRIEAMLSLKKGDHCNTFSITLFNHNGTHIDAPNHFDGKGKRILDYNIEDFVFNRPFLIDIPKKAGECITVEDLSIGNPNCDVLLLRTGFCRKRSMSSYANDNPWLSAEAAIFIRRNFRKVRALGIDTISIGSPRHPNEAIEAHRMLLGQKGFTSPPLLIIEDLNLGVLAGPVKRMYAVPVFVAAADSMPCTAFVEVPAE